MAADVTMTMDAKLAPAMRQYAKLLEKVKKTEGGMKALTKASSKATRQIERTGKAQQGFNALQGAANALKSTLAGMVGGGAVLAGFRSMLSGIQQEARAASEEIKAVHNESARLVQVASSKEDVERLNLQADLISVKEGIDRNAARRLMFGARSFGVSDDQVAQIAASARFSNIEEGGPEAFMTGVGKFQASGAYGRSVGNARQLISAFMAAGAPSDIAADVMAEQSIKALGETKAIGAGPDELLGVMSTLAKAFPSPEEAATAVRGLAKVIDKEGYGGSGVLGGLEAFEAADPKRLTEVIKSNQRAKAAYVAIQSPGAKEEIAQRTEEVAYARRSGALYDEQLEKAEAPRLTRVQQTRALEMSRSLQLEGRGGEQLEYENMRDAVDVLLNEQGYGPARRWAYRKAAESMAFFMGPEATTRGMESEIGGGLNAAQVITAAIQVMNDQVTKELRQINGNTRGPTGTPLGAVGNQ